MSKYSLSFLFLPIRTRSQSRRGHNKALIGMRTEQRCQDTLGRKEGRKERRKGINTIAPSPVRVASLFVCPATPSPPLRSPGRGLPPTPTPAPTPSLPPRWTEDRLQSPTHRVDLLPSAYERSFLRLIKVAFARLAVFALGWGGTGKCWCQEEQLPGSFRRYRKHL